MVQMNNGKKPVEAAIDSASELRVSAAHILLNDSRRFLTHLSGGIRSG